MAAEGKVIITCAVTGAIHTPTMSPYLPITPDQIAAEALAAAEAGAVIEKVERDRRARVPQEKLGERQIWRDRRLMALAAHKRRAAGEIGE